ncbi:hypothetical protein DFR67_11577 [Williamsia limnetica]|jgi:hypothetical protein|uniref:Uncharacterized protein n=1 Tax=Williamsia limnetica TaxID=882452 RepID=A0A318RPV2_WILLI|nr:hypothetical protein [Williamsia limnetica]PYE13752.1 hypothetical protein DFR67_11577 [Williamsia limnetica]
MLLPPVQALADRDVAKLLYTLTGVIDPALAAVEHLDPLGIKRRTFSTVERQANQAMSSEALITKVIGAIDDSLVWASDNAGLPGTARWASWTAEERRDWWIKRVGPISTVAVAYPGVFGIIADRLPLQTVIGFAQQAVLLCAVARAYGVDDRHRHVDLLARVLLNRNLDSKAVLSTTDAHTHASVSNDLARGAWNGIGKSRSILSELARRPSSRQPWRLLGALPVVGAAADYIGETGALRRAADNAVKNIR